MHPVPKKAEGSADCKYYFFILILIIFLLDTILPVINALSEFLQSKSADATQALVLVDATKQLLSNMRDQAIHSKSFSKR